MGISLIGSAPTAVSPIPRYSFVNANTQHFIPLQGAAGIYTLRVWNANLLASPTGTFEVLSTAGVTLITRSFVDFDTASTSNEAKSIFRATSAIMGITILSNQNSWVALDFNNSYPAERVLTTATHSSSGTITLASNSIFALLGAGGGGALGGTSDSNAGGGGGGGGGGGFLTRGYVPLGSYALVVGAGGTQNNAGGTSTFNSITAEGGLGASNGGNKTGVEDPGGGGGGGAGGSGGGNGGNGSTNNAQSPGGGQLGASNGAGAGGSGSGVQPPTWASHGTTPGSRYSGGSGGAGLASAFGGTRAPSGGGGGGLNPASGINGGAGGLITLSGL